MWIQLQYQLGGNYPPWWQLQSTQNADWRQFSFRSSVSKPTGDLKKKHCWPRENTPRWHLIFLEHTPWVRQWMQLQADCANSIKFGCIVFDHILPSVLQFRQKPLHHLCSFLQKFFISLGTKQLSTPLHESNLTYCIGKNGTRTVGLKSKNGFPLEIASRVLPATLWLPRTTKQSSEEAGAHRPGQRQNSTKWCKQDKWLLYLRLYCLFWPPVRLPMPQFVNKSPERFPIVFWKSRHSASGLGVLPCCFSLLQATAVQAFTNVCINAFSVNSEMIKSFLCFLPFLRPLDSYCCRAKSSSSVAIGDVNISPWKPQIAPICHVVSIAMCRLTDSLHSLHTSPCSARTPMHTDPYRRRCQDPHLNRASKGILCK